MLMPEKFSRSEAVARLRHVDWVEGAARPQPGASRPSPPISSSSHVLSFCRSSGPDFKHLRPHSTTVARVSAMYNMRNATVHHIDWKYRGACEPVPLEPRCPTGCPVQTSDFPTAINAITVVTCLFHGAEGCSVNLYSWKLFFEQYSYLTFHICVRELKHRIVLARLWKCRLAGVEVSLVAQGQVHLRYVSIEGYRPYRRV